MSVVLAHWETKKKQSLQTIILSVISVFLLLKCLSGKRFVQVKLNLHFGWHLRLILLNTPVALTNNLPANRTRTQCFDSNIVHFVDHSIMEANAHVNPCPYKQRYEWKYLHRASFLIFNRKGILSHTYMIISIQVSQI